MHLSLTSDNVVLYGIIGSYRPVGFFLHQLQVGFLKVQHWIGYEAKRQVQMHILFSPVHIYTSHATISSGIFYHSDHCHIVPKTFHDSQSHPYASTETMILCSFAISHDMVILCLLMHFLHYAVNYESGRNGFFLPLKSYT